MTKTLSDLMNLAKSTGVPESRIGYAIMLAVVKNKDRNKEVYNQGTGRSDYFKKLEANAIHSGLEMLIRDSIFPSARSIQEPKDALSDSTRRMFRNEGEIFTMNFVYDAVVYLGSKKISLDEMAIIIGSAACKASEPQLDQKKPADLRQGYYDFMVSLQKSISEKFNVYL